VLVKVVLRIHLNIEELLNISQAIANRMYIPISYYFLVHGKGKMKPLFLKKFTQIINGQDKNNENHGDIHQTDLIQLLK
jgi:hypothetical protein